MSLDNCLVPEDFNNCSALSVERAIPKFRTSKLSISLCYCLLSHFLALTCRWKDLVPSALLSDVLLLCCVQQQWTNPPKSQTTAKPRSSANSIQLRPNDIAEIQLRNDRTICLPCRQQRATSQCFPACVSRREAESDSDWRVGFR